MTWQLCQLSNQKMTKGSLFRRRSRANPLWLRQPSTEVSIPPSPLWMMLKNKWTMDSSSSNSTQHQLTPDKTSTRGRAYPTILMRLPDWLITRLDNMFYRRALSSMCYVCLIRCSLLILYHKCNIIVILYMYSVYWFYCIRIIIACQLSSCNMPCCLHELNLYERLNASHKPLKWKSCTCCIVI